MTWPHGDPSRVVRDVLAQPVYRSLIPSTDVEPKPSLLGLAWTWLVDHVLRPLLHPIAKVLFASNGAGRAIGVLLVVLALAALAFALYRLVLAFVRPQRSPAADAGRAVALATARSSFDWRALARAAAARGDFGSAIAALFAAALVALDERAVVAFDPARTPGEYRRLVRRAKLDASPPFDDLTELFVRAAYAPEAAGAVEFAGAERAFDAFEPAAAR